MKFRTYLETIVGVEVYPLISLLLFVIFFVIMTLWILSMSRSEVDHAKNLPFE